ncbi:MAG: hypothetical protein RLZZ338_1439, partial [Cyanobacteriota bacterium]
KIDGELRGVGFGEKNAVDAEGGLFDFNGGELIGLCFFWGVVD